MRTPQSENVKFERLNGNASTILSKHNVRIQRVPFAMGERSAPAKYNKGKMALPQDTSTGTRVTMKGLGAGACPAVGSPKVPPVVAPWLAGSADPRKLA